MIKIKQTNCMGKRKWYVVKGKPGYKTPKHIIDAGIRGLEQTKTKYTPIAGIIELRDAISWKLKNGNYCKREKLFLL